jgi:hypothetical protein
MEKLARHLGIEMAQTANMTQRVSDLAAKHKAMQEAEARLVAQRTSAFMEVAVSLATWFPERHTPRRRWASKVIDSLDPRKLPLPDAVKKLQMETWNSVNKTFEQAAHHKAIPAEDFDRHMRRFEDFLLDQLTPRALADHQRLEDIVREGEADA